MKSDELLSNAKADHAFMTKNEHKPDRERWVLDQWLAAQDRHPKEISQGDDPPDFVVDGTGIEVVEAMRAARRRGDEYKDKAKVAEAKAGCASVTPGPSLREVREHGHTWILNQVKQKAAKGYDENKSSRWTLLVYVNFPWTDKIQWQLLETNLTEFPLPFACVDAVYSDETGHVARTVFVARKDGTQTLRGDGNTPKAADIKNDVEVLLGESSLAAGVSQDGDIYVDLLNRTITIEGLAFQLHPATPGAAPDPATIKFTAPHPGPVADSWDIHFNGKTVGWFSISVQRKDGFFRVVEARTYDAALPNAAQADVIAHAWVQSFDAGDSPLPIRRNE
jgi:hypothetical protein